jgi:hypothetical protein
MRRRWRWLTLAVVGAWPLIGPPPGGFTSQNEKLVGWSNYTQWSQLGAFNTFDLPAVTPSTHAR